MTTTYPHVYVLADETRIPGLNSRRTYTCACGAALNVPQDDTEPKERIDGDNCPTSMRAWLDGVEEALEKARAEGRAEEAAQREWDRKPDDTAVLVRHALDSLQRGRSE